MRCEVCRKGWSSVVARSKRCDGKVGGVWVGRSKMWVMGACLCFFSVQVLAHVHCVCVL